MDLDNLIGFCFIPYLLKVDQLVAIWGTQTGFFLKFYLFIFVYIFFYCGTKHIIVFLLSIDDT